MRGRWYIRLTGCPCGREHQLVDPDWYNTLQTPREVPMQFASFENACDNGNQFIAWAQANGSSFDGFEVQGVH